jgi:hypothetical protein
MGWGASSRDRKLLMWQEHDEHLIWRQIIPSIFGYRDLRHSLPYRLRRGRLLLQSSKQTAEDTHRNSTRDEHRRIDGHRSDFQVGRQKEGGPDRLGGGWQSGPFALGVGSIKSTTV